MSGDGAIVLKTQPGDPRLSIAHPTTVYNLVEKDSVRRLAISGSLINGVDSTLTKTNQPSVKPCEQYHQSPTLLIAMPITSLGI